jgi:parallel beta-helix repeat protein
MGQYQPSDGVLGLNSGTQNLTLVCGNNWDTQICGLNHYNSGQQDEQLPILELRVNFHFIGPVDDYFIPLGQNDWSDNNGDTQARLARNAANSVLDDLIHNQIYVEAHQLDWEYIGDSRMRVVIYTEEDETSDQHNGVWYHPNIAAYNSFINNAPYGNKVINVRVVDTSPDACSMRGATPCGGNSVTINNWWSALQNWDTCVADEGFWNAGRILVHELLHQGNLCHSYKLDNECALDGLNGTSNPEGDLDPFWECSGAYGTDVDDSGISCGLSDPDATPCTSWVTGSSWNIMTEGVQKSCLSRCQWTVAMRSFLQNSHEWTNVCEVEEEPLVISSNTTWNTLQIIKNREVIIESGVELEINSCQVRMPAGGVIRVKRGAKLDMSASTITNLCRGERWGGIYVEGNPTKPHPTVNGNQAIDDAGIVSISNCTLTNGSHAIVTHKYQENWNSQYYGGLVDCLNTYFIDNKKGIAFYKHDKQDNSRIRGCTFEASGNTDFPATQGVSVWSCRNIEFSDNTFRNLDYGILPYNSKIRVLNGNTFTNLTVGIDIYSTHPNASEDIIGNIDTGTGNSFSDNGHHIQINAGAGGGGFSIIRHNNFVNASLPSIILDGEQTLSVIENDFSDDIFAFLSRNTTQGVVGFECNNVNSAVGFFAQGNNDNLVFSANDFDTGSADTYIESYGGNLGSVFIRQGKKSNESDDFSASNFFNHNNSSALDIVTLGETVPFFYINPTESPSEYTPEVLDNNYFLDPLDKEADECGDIAIGSMIGEPPYDVVKLDDIRQIEALAKLEKEAYPNDAEKERYYAEAARAKEKVLTWLVKEAIDNSEYASAENYLSVETDKRHKKSLYGVKVVKGDYVEADAYLQTIPEEDAIDTEFKMLQDINLQWLQNGTPPGVLLENSIVQNPNASGNGRGFYLTDAQNTFLTDVAFSESPNRSTARALLAIIKGERFTNPVDITKYEEYVEEVRERNKSHFTQKFGVFPNPTDKLLFVKLFDKSITAENVNIEIFDMSGQLLLYQETDGEFSKTRLNVETLNAGLYFLRVKDSNNILHQEKVVILN